MQIFFLFFFSNFSSAFGDDTLSGVGYEEKRLLHHLLRNYEQVGTHGRPVDNSSAALPVTIRFSLIQILEIDPKIQVFDFVGWVYLVSAFCGTPTLFCQACDAMSL